MMKKMFLVVGLLLGSLAYAGTTVPFEASVETELHFVGPCGPNCATATMIGVGQALQGGRVSMDGLAQLNVATGAQTGMPTFTAADGSTLTISLEGAFTPAGPQDITFSGVWTAISGTGRFEGVSGDGTYDGFGSGSTGVVHFHGTLNNPGRR
ncbi:MAG TPA: hypothetical protein VFY29_11245 [Terriglobia bacterium]|nr:hypothetical protein [Terriglobia bacterium]